MSCHCGYKKCYNSICKQKNQYSVSEHTTEYCNWELNLLFWHRLGKQRFLSLLSESYRNEIKKKLFLWLPSNTLIWFSFLLVIASLYYKDLSSSDYIQYISQLILPEQLKMAYDRVHDKRNMTESLHHWGVSQDNEHDHGQDFTSCECNSPRNVLQTTLIPVQMSEWTLLGFSFAEELRSDNKTESASKKK